MSIVEPGESVSYPPTLPTLGVTKEEEAPSDFSAPIDPLSDETLRGGKPV